MCLSLQTTKHQQAWALRSREPCNVISVLLSMASGVFWVHLLEQVNRPEKSLTARVTWPPPALPFSLLSCRHKAGSPEAAVNHSSLNTNPGSGFLEEIRPARPCSGGKAFGDRTTPSSLFLFPAPSVRLFLTLLFVRKVPSGGVGAAVCKGCHFDPLCS